MFNKIKDTANSTIKKSKKATNENKEEMVDSLEEFLEDDEIK